MQPKYPKQNSVIIDGFLRKLSHKTMDIETDKLLDNWIFKEESQISEYNSVWNFPLI